MHITVTTDPISMNDIETPDHNLCLYDGDGDNGLEIYFESEKNREEFIEFERDKVEDHQIVLQGNNSADYVAEG